MSEAKEVVCFGAGAFDVYPPEGEVGPKHIPGAKVGWSEETQTRLEMLLETSAERHVGGNALNVVAYMACHNTRGETVVFASILGGEDDPASTFIRRHLGALGIVNRALTVPGYEPSVSIIERKASGSDRMVYGRRRTPMNGYMTEEYIRTTTKDAALVAAASLKDVLLTRRVFAQTPDTAFLSYNPGSSEFNDHPADLITLMNERTPDLLALNDEEAALLLGADADTDPRRLAEIANQYARYVLCTLGKAGMLLAHNGSVIHRPAQDIPSGAVKDTLGAGDRAHAVTIQGLRAGLPAEQILDAVAESTAQVILHNGAHGDLYERIY
jgi:sugar/nucleoside kinase (ribokinase family)